MKHFDAHCHIQFEPYDADRDALIERMREEETGGIVVGVDYASSRSALELVGAHEHLFAAAGLHPNHASDEEFDMDAYRVLLSDPKMVAVGECGLDFYRPEDVDAAKERQKELFRKHVELAVSIDKPLIIHARPSKGTMDAYQDLIGILTEYKKEYGDKLRGDVHFFVGGVEEARALVALGFTISYTAVITFARDYDDAIRSVPLESLLSETDSPYVAPIGRRGERNDPLSAKDVVLKIAEIRSEDPETVRDTLLRNAKRLFGL